MYKYNDFDEAFVRERVAQFRAPGIGPQSPADNNYQPGFAADLMLKDLRLSQQAAQAADADTPMGQQAAALYETFVEAEDGAGKDFSAMLPRFEKRSRG